MTQYDNFVLLHITAWGWSGCWHLQVGGWTTRGHAKFYWKQVTIIKHSTEWQDCYGEGGAEHGQDRDAVCQI